MINFETAGFGLAWVRALGVLLTDNTTVKHVAPRGKGTREVLGVTFRVDDPLRNILAIKSRDLNYRFMVAEWLWISAGMDEVEPLAKFNSRMREFSDDGFVLRGAYGPRIINQFAWVRDKLQEPDTRQAVVSIWTPRPLPSKDIPCTLTLQFLQREGRLNTIVTMRSSDVWLGLPYDFFTFSMIQNAMAGTIGAEVGWLQMQLGSMHLYDEHKQLAIIALVENTTDRDVVSPVLKGWPWDANKVLLGEQPETMDKSMELWWNVLHASKTKADAFRRLQDGV